MIIHNRLTIKKIHHLRIYDRTGNTYLYSSNLYENISEWKSEFDRIIRLENQIFT